MKKIKRDEIPQNLPPHKIANFLNNQLIEELSNTLTKGRGKYFILIDYPHNSNKSRRFKKKKMLNN